MNNQIKKRLEEKLSKYTEKLNNLESSEKEKHLKKVINRINTKLKENINTVNKKVKKIKKKK